MKRRCRLCVLRMKPFSFCSCGACRFFSSLLTQRRGNLEQRKLARGMSEGTAVFAKKCTYCSSRLAVMRLGLGMASQRTGAKKSVHRIVRAGKDHKGYQVQLSTCAAVCPLKVEFAPERMFILIAGLSLRSALMTA